MFFVYIYRWIFLNLCLFNSETQAWSSRNYLSRRFDLSHQSAQCDWLTSDLSQKLVLASTPAPLWQLPRTTECHTVCVPLRQCTSSNTYRGLGKHLVCPPYHVTWQGQIWYQRSASERSLAAMSRVPYAYHVSARLFSQFSIPSPTEGLLPFASHHLQTLPGTCVGLHYTSKDSLDKDITWVGLPVLN